MEFGSGYSGQNLYICFGQKSNTTTPKLIVSSIILSTDNSYNRFVPNYAVDLKTGRSYQNDAYLRGIVSTMDDMVVIKEEDRSIASWISVTDRGMFCRNDKSNSSAEIMAAFGVHKEYNTSGIWQSEYGYVELRDRIRDGANYNYANLSGYGLVFARHERINGEDTIPHQTNIFYSYVETDEVKTNKIVGIKTESLYGVLPPAFPRNVIGGSGKVQLPANPELGMFIFAKGTGGTDHDLVIDGNGHLIMSPSNTSTVETYNTKNNAFIFVYDGTRWIAFCCIDT